MKKKNNFNIKSNQKGSIKIQENNKNPSLLIKDMIMNKKRAKSILNTLSLKERSNIILKLLNI